MRQGLSLSIALVMGVSLGAAGFAAADSTSATGAAGGTFASGSQFAGVAVSAIQTGFGVDIGADGLAHGQFTATLLGTSSLGLEQNITLAGEVPAGTRPAPTVAVFSGTASVDMGDGLPPAEGIPFTATVTANVNGQGTLGLVTGLATLPAASLGVGSVTLE